MCSVFTASLCTAPSTEPLFAQESVYLQGPVLHQNKADRRKALKT